MSPTSTRGASRGVAASSRPVPPVYSGPFRKAQAERLLWRAGFGPRPGEAAALARRGLRGAVLSLTRPADHSLSGPAPTTEGGQPLAPFDAWGHDVLWWLDRMVRARAPLTERMTLIWHDWFATSNAGVNSQRLMIGQNQTQRKLGLASFPRMLAAMTADPAMLLWLSGVESTKEAPNENYAREMQELFTLGAGMGYTERDVREHARALTGFTSTSNPSTGQQQNFRFEASRHDAGIKVIYGRRGRFGWRDSLRLALGNQHHPQHFVTRMWSYLSPEPLSARDRRAFQAVYVSSGMQIRPLIEGMLMHPLIYSGARMVKPPIVQIAGMLRAIGRPIDTDAWAWEAGITGQMPFYPPNVAGWEASSWLNTGTWQARFNLVSEMIDKRRALTPSDVKRVAKLDPSGLLDEALAFWAEPTISTATRRVLTSYAKAAVGSAAATWERGDYPSLALNGLRALVVATPDYQTC